jgi:UDP-glucose 4-epimerase
MAKILVTGGAGYVGSHVVRELLEGGESVTVIDDLSTGHRAALGQVPLVQADFGDREVLDELMGDGSFEFVLHFAAFTEVGQSMVDPAAYYRNNMTSSLTLLDAVRRHGVRGLVFSSSAAVYGEPERVPIEEDHPLRPTNPYGETKLGFERALAWYHEAYGTRHISLRYFNAAGAHPASDIGEDHARETHLVPLLIRSALEQGACTPIFGDDYPTRDGTCVRDYVHVVDLARAHTGALAALREGTLEACSLNLGNGEGFTVREVVDAVERVVGRRPPTHPAPRRAGDPATLVASSDRARQRLGWRPEYASLESIVSTAWEWHHRNPQGFEEPPSPAEGAS